MNIFNRNDQNVISNAFSKSLPHFQEIYKGTSSSPESLERAYHQIRTEKSKGIVNKPWAEKATTTLELIKDEEFVNGLPLSKEFDIIIVDDPGVNLNKDPSKFFEETIKSRKLSNKEFTEGLEKISKENPNLPQIKKISSEIAKKTVVEYNNLSKPKTKSEIVKEYYNSGLTKVQVYEKFVEKGEKIDKTYISDLFKKFQNAK
jgi:hypothetical protein